MSIPILSSVRRSILKMPRLWFMYFLATTLVLCFLVLFLRDGLEHRLTSEGRSVIGEGDTVDLWFTPGGDLMRIRQEGGRVAIERWPSGRIGGDVGSPLIRVFDLAVEVSSPAIVPRLSWGALYPISPGAVVPYAVSEDGELFGWFWKGVIHVSRIYDNSTSRVSGLETNSYAAHEIGEIVSFCFVGDDRVVFVRGNALNGYFVGGLSLVQGKVAGWSLPLNDDWTLWSRGSTLAFASFSSGDLLSISVDDWQSVVASTQSIVPSSGSALSVDVGGLTVGTIGGSVWRVSNNSKTYISLPSSQPVRTLGYFEDYIVAGGDFFGIQFIGRNGSVREVPSPQGIRILASRPPYLAFASAETTEVMRVSKRLMPSDAGLLYMASFSLLVSLLALLNSLWIDGRVGAER